jgi:hypothetical protein
MEKEAGIIAHSCGVANPRLRRIHCRIVEADRHSVSMSELFYPDTVKADRRTAVAEAEQDRRRSGRKE